MISKENYLAISQLHVGPARESIKREVYYDINKTLKNAKKNTAYIDIYHINISVLIEVSFELNTNGYFNMLREDYGSTFLRMYLKDN